VGRGRWASLMNLLVCRGTGLVCSKLPRGPAEYGSSARDGPSAPGGQKTREQGSPVCSTGDQRHLVRRVKLPNRGVRERLDADAGCHAAPGGTRPFCCEYSESRCRKTGIGLSACANSEVALGKQSDCGAVRLLSTQIVRKQAKAISISNDAARCMRRRRQRFPTVRTVSEVGNSEV
jgi:hypothetical protein